MQTLTAAPLPRSDAPAQDRPGSPVVLVGGVGQPALSWAAWARELRELGVPCAVAAVPRLGFACRDSYHRAIGDARRSLLKAHDLPDGTPVSLTGFSAGGAGSVAYLARHPRQIDRVVAISSPLRGNELATGATALLRGRTPRWIRDLSGEASAVRDLRPHLARRVTSLVGAGFDGLISARSGCAGGIRVVRVADVGVRTSLHVLMHERGPQLRRAAWHALA